MADGTFGVREPPTTPDQYVDTDQLTNDAGTVVQRERVEDPELMMLLRGLEADLATLAQCIAPPISSVLVVPAGGGVPASQSTSRSASLRVTTMAPGKGSGVVANASGSINGFTNPAHMAINAWERWNLFNVSGFLGPGAPGYAIFDPLAQMLSLNVRVS